jgi:MYXO-CTERM domain-containing protein
MKKTLSLIAVIASMGVASAASIAGLDSSYTKDSTTYNGTTGDTVTISTTTNPLNLYTGNNWTAAFTISDMAVTTGSNVGILYTYNTSKPYYNIEGIGYQLTGEGALTLCVGGFNYNGGTAASSPWKTQSITGWTSGTALNIFYEYNNGNVNIYVMLGNDESTYTQLASLSSGAAFSGEKLTQFNMSAKSGSGNTWTAPNGVTGAYTLENMDIYNQLLTADQKKEYALSANPVPEPTTAALGLIGLSLLALRRRV